MRRVSVALIVGAALAAFVAVAPLAAAATTAPTTPLKDPFAPVLVAPSTPATTAVPGTTPGSPPASTGGTPSPAPGDGLAFSGVAGVPWLALGAVAAISAGLALRPRRRAFPGSHR